MHKPNYTGRMGWDDTTVGDDANYYFGFGNDGHIADIWRDIYGNEVLYIICNVTAEEVKHLDGDVSLTIGEAKKKVEKMFNTMELAKNGSKSLT